MPAILIGKDQALKNEKKTVQSIANNLGDDWYVLVPARKVSTEGDVILVNKDHLIFIEIKNSHVKYQKGGFIQQNRKSKTWKNIDPIAQLENVFHNLVPYKEKIFETNRYLHENYFLFTPESHSAGIPDEISNNLSQIHLGNLNQDLEKFLKNNSKKFDKTLTPKEIKNIINTIVPDGDHLSIIKSIEGVVEERIVEATVQQKRVLKSLGETKTLSVLGGAGTGKTVLAVEAAKNMASNKNKVLFLCYNQNLSRYLNNLFNEDPLIKVQSLFGFFTSININLKDIGTANLSPKDAAPVIAEALNENFDKFDTDFDVLIIDEAQDFSPLFWPRFELMTEGKKWFLFSDKRQAITHDDWALPNLENNSWLSYPLTKYLRSTKEISSKVLNVYEDEYDALAINGLEPEFLTIQESGWGESLETLSKVLTGLIDQEKYHPNQIQVLIPHSRYLEDVEQAKFKPNMKIGGVQDLNIESIYKYKGLESEVVVMVVPNLESLESETTSDIKSLIYVGMSRATSMLIVIGDEEVKKLANWDS